LFRVLALVVFAGVATSLALTRPLSYDEWFSWRFFSGVGFSEIFLHYPAPNNHVLYNSVARLFLLAGLDAEIAVRVPAIIASTLTLYFFYLQGRKFYSSPVALGLTIILAGNVAFLSFSAMGRGYAFVFLFTILFLSAIYDLWRNNSVKSGVLLVVAEVFGLLTMPSFLLVIPVPLVLTSLGFVFRTQWRRLISIIITQVIALFLTGLAYSGILFSNYRDILLHPEAWTRRFSFEAGWIGELRSYLALATSELFGQVWVWPLVLMICTSLFLLIRDKKCPYLWLYVLTAVTPLLYVLFQKVLPYSRTYSNFVIVVLLPAGLVLEQLIHFPGRRPYFRLVSGSVIPGVLVLLVLAVAGIFREDNSWEQTLKTVRSAHPHLLQKTSTVGCTGKGEEWYPRDLLGFMATKEKGETSTMTMVDSLLDEDIVLLDSSLISAYSRQLANYRQLIYHDNTYVYASEKLLVGDHGR
jgi:hypothetical protein